VIRRYSVSSLVPLRRLVRGAVLVCIGVSLAACQSGSRYGPEQTEAPRPEPALVAMTLAEAADRAGDGRAAVQFYSQAISEGTPGSKAHVRRGELLLDLGAPNEAAASFRQSLQAGVDDPAIHRGYARALAWLGQPEEALKQLDLALAASPLDVKAMNARGVALDAMNLHGQAQNQYQQALAVAPGDLSLQNNLALSYALAGDVGKAIDILERIYASGASRMQHRQNLALLYGLTGRADKAAALAGEDLSAEDAKKNLGVYATMNHLYEGRDASSPVPDGEAKASGKAAGKPWVVDLGSYASAADATDAWRRLRQQEAKELGELVHYLEQNGDKRRLIVGPVWDEQAARAICAALEAHAETCAVRPASLEPSAAKGGAG
jgi:Flp pilus assembly protein TadD